MIVDADLEARFAQQGWLAFDLPDPAPVHAVRARLLDALRERGVPTLPNLDDYHLLVTEDARHVSVLHELARLYWEEQLGRTIIERNLDFFRSLLGPDLHVQRRPYLRCVRPGKPQDAAPLHRDTYYGASPFEVSVLVPLTAMEEGAALRVVSGSHVEPDSRYPYTQHQSEDIAIRSPKHELGYPYAPRLLDPALDAHAVAVPLALGQAAMFGLSLVHGGGINASAHTRFSTDIRIVDSLAPVAIHRGVHDDYFVPLCSSAITRTARAYVDANAASAADERKR